MFCALIQESAEAVGTTPNLRKSAAEGSLELWGDFSLADPWALAILPIGIALLFWGKSRRPVGRTPVLPPSLPSRTLGQRFAWIPTACSALAIALVAVALARPLRGNVDVSSVSEGVDIALLVDRSSSMQHEDLAPNFSRLEVVKEVVGDFARRRMTDREGAADSIALVSFARYPQLLCPFTLDVNAVEGFLEQVELVQNRAEDGTGIGVALAKAVAVLDRTEGESKVVVLLTDGANNVERILPLQAAELAAEKKVRVYTVLAGRYAYSYDPFGNVRAQDVELDATELQQIAQMTGGKFFRAKDKEGLEEVYSEIEELERTEREEIERAEHWDLYPLFLKVALGLYVAGWLSLSTWARRLP